MRFCIVSSNELVVLDSLENSKQYKNAGKRFPVYRAYIMLAHTNCVHFLALTRKDVINFVCVHDSCIRFLLFSLVSIAVWIDYNRLQSTGAKLFCIWNFQLSAAFFGIGESPSRALWFTLLTSTQGRIYSVATNQNLRIIIYKGKTDN